MAAGAGLANSARWHTWTLELNLSDSGSRSRDQQCGQRDSTCPVACSDKQLPDICVQETDRILVEKRFGRGGFAGRKLKPNITSGSD
ncbi:ER membrane protein complex subunit 4-like isoform X2 [Mustelus asterias]